MEPRASARFWCYACSAEVRCEPTAVACAECGSDFIESLPDRPPSPPRPAVIPHEQLVGPNSVFQRLQAIIERHPREGRPLPPFLQMIRDVGVENIMLSL